MPSVKRLVLEIHRRSLWQVLLIYIGAGWIVFEIVQTVTEGLGLPPWFPAFAALLLLIGLPIVLATAFVQEGIPPMRHHDPTLVPGADVMPEAATGRATRMRTLFTWRNAITGGALAFALWGVIATVLLLRGQKTSPEAVEMIDTSAASTGIAVLPFRVVGSELELWREGMVDLLSINLDGATGLRAIDPRAVLSRWRAEIGAGQEPSDREAALRVARAVDARYALIGSVVGSETGVRLGVEVHDLEDDVVLGSTLVEGSPDSMLALVDDLTIELLRGGLASERAGLPQPALSRVTTSSPDAIKAYLAGEQSYRRSRWSDAVADFTRAVNADSTFALALNRLSHAYGWLEGFSPRVFEYGQRAARHVDRLPRREQLLFQANAEWQAGWLSGLERLEDLTARYPDDVEFWYELGEAYYHIGGQGLHLSDKFQTAFRRATALDPHFAPAYSHMFDFALQRDDSGTARQVIEALRQIDPTSAEVLGINLTFALVWGDSASRIGARAALDTASGMLLSSANRPLWFARDRAAAMQVARALYAERHAVTFRRTGLESIAQVYSYTGQLRKVRDALSVPPGMDDTGVRAARWYLVLNLTGYEDSISAHAGAELLAGDPALVDRFLIGGLAATEGRWGDVEDEIQALVASAGEVESLQDSLGAVERRAFARALEGYAALRRGESQAGVRTLEEALSELPGVGPEFVHSEVHAVLRLLLARALLDLDRPQEAERYLRSLDFFTWVTGAPTEFYLGRAYEALGRTEEAKLRYARFVRAWKACDPQLRPLWERGRDALARLTSEPAAP